MSQVSVGGELEWAIVEGTEDVSHCGCNAGGWLDLAGHCNYCGKGLICLGKGTVLLEENFFSSYENAGSAGRVLLSPSAAQAVFQARAPRTGGTRASLAESARWATETRQMVRVQNAAQRKLG
eukprot:CAMPEP_0194556730 /NCGR_PEP_ID=MMETSP0253-20130528/98891_1 /TAXON_ID=2966 /ORGANISM="Noctiluca scintillans" /LENGTH=122 /DNA_ID=CAMNT_0039404235 /DNA_START=825 /DNA_END=1190 /DNA_ORIENTATION=-